MLKKDNPDSKNVPDLTGDMNSAKHFTDEQTDKRIHAHLTDENDVISENDIRNVIVNFDEIPEVETDLDIRDDKVSNESDEEKNEDKSLKDNSDSNIETSWNILGS